MISFNHEAIIVVFSDSDCVQAFTLALFNLFLSAVCLLPEWFYIDYFCVISHCKKNSNLLLLRMDLVFFTNFVKF